MRSALGVPCLGDSLVLLAPNAKSVSERLRQLSHLVRPNPPRAECGSGEQYALLQEVVGLTADKKAGKDLQTRDIILKRFLMDKPVHQGSDNCLMS